MNITMSITMSTGTTMNITITMSMVTDMTMTMSIIITATIMSTGECRKSGRFCLPAA